MNQESLVRATDLHEQSIGVFTHVHEMFPEDFKKMRQGGISAAVVPVSIDGRAWADRRVWLNSLHNNDRFLADTLVAINYFHWLADQPDSPITLATEPEDLEAAKAEGKVAVIMATEGSRFLDLTMEALVAAYKLGLRTIAPMWAYDCACGGAQENSAAGLTDWGRSLVRAANDLGIIYDGNHASMQSLRDVLELSEQPILVSHSGARALNPEAMQLLPDDVLKAVAEAGGVVGMIFVSQILKPGWHQATLEELVRQFVYCAELVGTEHIAYGCDFPPEDPRLWRGNNFLGELPGPISWPVELEDTTKTPLLTAALLDHGFTTEEVKDMLGRNFIRLFEKVRGGAKANDVVTYEDAGNELGAKTGGMTPL